MLPTGGLRKWIAGYGEGTARRAPTKRDSGCSAWADALRHDICYLATGQINGNGLSGHPSLECENLGEHPEASPTMTNRGLWTLRSGGLRKWIVGYGEGTARHAPTKRDSG